MTFRFQASCGKRALRRPNLFGATCPIDADEDRYRDTCWWQFGVTVSSFVCETSQIIIKEYEVTTIVFDMRVSTKRRQIDRRNYTRFGSSPTNLPELTRVLPMIEIRKTFYVLDFAIVLLENLVQRSVFTWLRARDFCNKQTRRNDNVTSKWYFRIWLLRHAWINRRVDNKSPRRQ